MTTFPLPITAVFTAVLALMLVGVSIRITALRANRKINLFDGGDPQLGRAIRVQGNFTEYVPMALALLGLLEWTGAQPGALYATGIALVIARLGHAWGIYGEVFPARVAGTSLTWFVIAASALWLLARIA